MKQVIRRTAPLGIVVILALIVVLEAGMVIGGYIYYRKMAEIIQNNQFIDSLAPAPAPKPLFLSVDSLNGSLTSVDDEILVSGKTLPNTPVIAYSDADEFALESDTEGNFQDSLLLSNANGLVRVTAYGEDGEEKTLTFNLSEVGTTVLGRSVSKDIENNGKANKLTEKPATTKIEKIPSPKTPSLAVSPSLKVSEKITPTPVARSKKTSEFLSEKTQIKKVEKLGAARIVTLLNSEPDLELKLPTKKLESVEVTQAVEFKRHAISGVIINNSAGVITLAHQIQRDREVAVYYNSATRITIKDNPDASSAQLVPGMRIVAVGVPSEDGLLASKILVIPGKATGILTKNPISPAPSSTTTPTPTPTASPIPSASPTVSGTPSVTLTVSPTVSLTPSTTVSPTASDQ